MPAMPGQVFWKKIKKLERLVNGKEEDDDSYEEYEDL
jgi:hypothetical protein